MRRGSSVSRSWPPISSARFSAADIRPNCQPAGSWTSRAYHSIGTNSGNVSALHQLIDGRRLREPATLLSSLVVRLPLPPRIRCRARDARTTKFRKRDSRAANASNAARIQDAGDRAPSSAVRNARFLEIEQVLEQAEKIGSEIKRRPYSEYIDGIEKTGCCQVEVHGIGPCTSMDGWIFYPNNFAAMYLKR